MWLRILRTWMQARAAGQSTPHATLVWAVRDAALLRSAPRPGFGDPPCWSANRNARARSFAPLLQALVADREDCALQLYCTGELEPGAAEEICPVRARVNRFPAGPA